MQKGERSIKDDAITEIRKDTLWRFRRLTFHECILRREIVLTSPKSYFDAMGPVAAFGICRRNAGSLIYEADGGKIQVPWREYGVFMPPFSLTRAHSENLDLNIDILVTTAPLKDLPEKSFVFPLAQDLPHNFDDARGLLPPSKDRLNIDFCSKPTALSSKIKKALDESFKENMFLAEVANRLRVSQTVMGRYFKRDFGLAPLAYRNHMRIMSASLDLVAGANIIDSFQTVGFEDLSQFYKQFKRVTKATPGEYSKKKSKITKNA